MSCVMSSIKIDESILKIADLVDMVVKPDVDAAIIDMFVIPINPCHRLGQLLETLDRM